MEVRDYMGGGRGVTDTGVLRMTVENSWSGLE